MADQQLRIGPAETVVVISPITTLAAGVHVFRVNTVGNSLLSTLYVAAAASPVSARWYDFGAARETSDAGAQTTLATHGPQAAFSTTRKLVTRIHNSCFVEITVGVGGAAVGLIATLVSDFPVELKGNVLNGQTANLALDGGVPITVYDPSDGKFYLLQGSGGSLAVSSPLTTGKMQLATIGAADVEQSHTFPAGTRRFGLKARGPGRLKLSFDATQSVDGKTISPGTAYASPEFAAAAARTIYFQSPVAGLVVELESWS